MGLLGNLVVHVRRVTRCVFGRYAQAQRISKGRWHYFAPWSRGLLEKTTVTQLAKYPNSMEHNGHYRICRRRPLVSNLSQTKPIHNLVRYYSKVWIHTYGGFPKRSFPFAFSDLRNIFFQLKIVVYIFFIMRSITGKKTKKYFSDTQYHYRKGELSNVF